MGVPLPAAALATPLRRAECDLPLRALGTAVTADAAAAAAAALGGSLRSCCFGEAWLEPPR